MPNVSPLIVVVGPTASGKSALAMQLAQAHNGEIIAADSRTIYRGMDIGTAKPTAHDQQLVPHHLIDVREPDQSFSAAEFKQLALQAIDDIASRESCRLWWAELACTSTLLSLIIILVQLQTKLSGLS
jgi:tRNA dimethylallyltransferase